MRNTTRCYGLLPHSRSSLARPGAKGMLMIGMLTVTWSVGCVTTTFFSRSPATSQPIGSVAEALTTIRESRDTNQRRDAYQYLGKPDRLGDEQARQEVADILSLSLASEADPHLRSVVLESLSRYVSPQANQAIIGATGDKETSVRIAACRILGREVVQEATPKLEELLVSDPNLDVRLAAAGALGEMSNREAAAALLTGISDPDVALRHRCHESLQKMTGQDHGADLAAWRQEIQTANFEQLPHQRTKFKLF